MRRMNWKTVSTLVTMVVIAGCQENVVSPELQSTSAPTKMSLAPQSRPQLQLNSTSAANASGDFTVGPNGGAFFIGRNAVYFPAHSICNPATSSYGVGHWDDSCAPLTTSIRIHAVTKVINGRNAVDFSPALRFVPSNDPSRWVWLYKTLPGAGLSNNLAPFNILYTPVLGGAAYDEAATDPSLRTYVVIGLGVRRVKHFSGNTSSDVWCDGDIVNDVCINDGGWH